MKFFSRRDTKNLQYEFLPSALEIIETPSSPFGRIVIWLTIALLAIAITWSYVGRIDVIAIAQGKVVPVGNVKTIQSAAAGVVTSINVSEGERVKKGQLLIELDSSLAEADVVSLEKSLVTARLERDILKKTLAGEDASDTINSSQISQEAKDDLVELARSKSSVNEVKRRLMSLTVSQASTQLAAERQQQSSIESNIQKARNREQELRNQIAQASGSQTLTLQSQLNDVLGQISTYETTLSSQKQRVTQAQASIDRAQVELSGFDVENSASTASSVVDQDKRIAEIEDALTKSKKTVNQLKIKAPVDGTILSMTLKTIGGVVTAAQPLAVIVPEGTPLIVEANIKNKDIGFIAKGQKAAVKVDTYSFQRYGYLVGTVTSVGADAVEDEKQGSIYKMKIKLDTTKTSKDNSIQVSPGMSVTSEITTGDRRIIEFFLNPLMTHTDTSLKQR